MRYEEKRTENEMNGSVAAAGSQVADCGRDKGGSQGRRN